jgi:hypothetical protein
MTASSLGRTVVWFVGLALLIAALVVAWDASGASRSLPTGFLVAGILLIVGIAVLLAADTIFPAESRVERYTYAQGNAPAYPPSGGPYYSSPPPYTARQTDEYRREPQ